MKPCPLGPWKPWLKIGADGRPDDTTKQGFKQPDTIEIKHTVDGREQTAKVVPDGGFYGPEWAYDYTIPQFTKNVVKRWNINGRERYEKFAQCLTDEAKTEWETLMADEFSPPTVEQNEDTGNSPSLATSRNWATVKTSRT